MINSAKCHFCDKPFRNRQAVRAHLKGCAVYRQMPKATLPNVGITPPQRVSKPDDAREFDLETPEPARQDPRQAAALRREYDRAAARLLAQQEAQAREWRELAQRAARERRRALIQRVKDRAIANWSPPGYMIPPEAKAQALKAVEAELGRLPVEELPEAELMTLAEGVRDRIYQPLMRAQDQAREEQARRQRRRADLTESALAHATRTLEEADGLDTWSRFRLIQKVRRALADGITGNESERDVCALVDPILAPELAAAGEKRRQVAQSELIADGAAYAARELARETDLAPPEQQRIARLVKQELQRAVSGTESARDVKGVVDKLLDDERGEAEADEEFDDDACDADCCDCQDEWDDDDDAPDDEEEYEYDEEDEEDEDNEDD